MVLNVEYAALLDELRSSSYTPSGSDFNRANLIRSLDIIARHLGDALATSAGKSDDGFMLLYSHPVAEHIHMLSEALADVEHGVTDPILKAPDKRRGAKLHARQRERDRILLQGLQIFQRQHNLKTRTEAAHKFAKALKKGGYTRRGKALSAAQLIRLAS